MDKGGIHAGKHACKLPFNALDHTECQRDRIVVTRRELDTDILSKTTNPDSYMDSSLPRASEIRQEQRTPGKNHSRIGMEIDLK